jgi:2-oxoglutarate ferredoxin oxidoreductase subunit alpha
MEYRIGVIFFGTTTHAAYEAISRFSKSGLKINSLRLRAFPFQNEVIEFINEHETIFVIEQNRDAQLRTMLMTENAISPRKLQSILNFDGLPITADFITENIQARLGNENQTSPQDSKGGKA